MELSTHGIIIDLAFLWFAVRIRLHFNSPPREKIL